MTVEEYYAAAKKDNHQSLALLIEYLVYERKALKMEDDPKMLSFYLQEKFKVKMNEYLSQYQEERNGQTA